jgi:hypothetical protein
METANSKELRKSIDEQMLQIKSVVDGFELFVPKDEAALREIDGILRTVTGHVREMDEARLKRRHLMGELSKALGDLEDAQGRFAKSAKADTP